MGFPDLVKADYCRSNEPTQLEALVHGIIAHVLADLISSRQIPVQAGVNQTAEFLRRHPSQAFDCAHSDGAWAIWIKNAFRHLLDDSKLLNAFNHQLASRGIHTRSASKESWLKIFYHWAFAHNDIEIQAACLDWLKGQSVSEENAKTIGLPQGECPKLDAGPKEMEELAKNRLLDFCQLAAFFRPFIFCLDQTENYGANPDLAKCLAFIIQEMVDYGQNSMVLLTANIDPWQKKLRPHFEESHLDRLSPYLELEGITLVQGKELLAQRLEGFPDAANSQPLCEGSWIASIFQGVTRMGVRQFLQKAREKWEHHEGAASKKTLHEIHAEYVNKIKSKPKNQCFAPDFFYWLVRDVGALLPQNKVKPGTSHHSKYFPLRWQMDDKTFLFSFESGNNWRRWESIMRTSGREYQDNKSTNGVLFRTPDLAGTPRPSWKIHEMIEQARRTHLRLLELSPKEVAYMYACKEMHSDAMQGDLEIPATGEEILRFTSDKLLHWWKKRFSESPQADSPSSALHLLPASNSAQVLIDALGSLMQKHKFISLAGLLALLPSGTTDDAVYKAASYMPEIKIHTSPTEIVFQWLPFI